MSTRRGFLNSPVQLYENSARIFLPLQAIIMRAKRDSVSVSMPVLHRRILVYSERCSLCRLAKLAGFRRRAEQVVAVVIHPTLGLYTISSGQRFIALPLGYIYVVFAI